MEEAEATLRTKKKNISNVRGGGTFLLVAQGLLVVRLLVEVVRCHQRSCH